MTNEQRTAFDLTYVVYSWSNTWYICLIVQHLVLKVLKSTTVIPEILGMSHTN